MLSFHCHDSIVIPNSFQILITDNSNAASSSKVATCCLPTTTDKTVDRRISNLYLYNYVKQKAWGYKKGRCQVK